MLHRAAKSYRMNDTVQLSAFALTQDISVTLAETVRNGMLSSRQNYVLTIVSTDLVVYTLRVTNEQECQISRLRKHLQLHEKPCRKLCM